MRIHQVPTHLQVEDRLLLGLTIRQALPLALGAAGGYWLWQHALLSPASHLLLVGLVGLAASAVAFLQPDGYSLPTWFLLVTTYAQTPRHTVWHGTVMPPQRLEPQARSVKPGHRRHRHHSYVTQLQPVAVRTVYKEGGPVAW